MRVFNVAIKCSAILERYIRGMLHYKFCPESQPKKAAIRIQNTGAITYRFWYEETVTEF